MPQDIHLEILDSLAPCCSFLTAQEHDQELLILWNGFELVKIINSISGDRVAAVSYVRAKMQRLGHVWTEQLWMESVEPRVWHWLCWKAVRRERVPALQVKRVRIPKGWTIAVDACTLHGGAPVRPGLGPHHLRVHVYAVNRSIDRALAGHEAIRTSLSSHGCVNFLSYENPYFLILAWAQMQDAAPFGPAE
jgi:hypothetical protein